MATSALRDFARLLKTYRERVGRTHGDVATRVGVNRASYTQWESARHLPSPDRVQRLDDLLDAGGELVAAAARARGQRLEPVGSTPTTGASGQRTLLQLLGDIRTALLAQICEDQRGRPGWRHNLVPSAEPVTTLSTAYGLGALALLGGPDARTPAIVQNVLERAFRDDDGRLIGWRARTQKAPRLDSTSAALDALLTAGVSITVDDVLRMTDTLLDDLARERPYVMAMALQPVLRVAPDSELARTLVDALLACRIEVDGVLLWPEKLLHREQRRLTASVAHTARALTVLRRAPSELVGDAVVGAEQWLTGADNLGGVSENIRRTLSEDEREDITIDHFTAAWVARALAGSPTPDRRQITTALTVVWERFDPQIHLWAWGNGDVPVWQLRDALAAVQESALALRLAPIPPIPVAGDPK